MSMKYSRYFEARYVCYNHPISTIYVSGILQKYYTYHLPDMCEYYCYSIHIGDYIQSYRVPDRYPITSILTCGPSIEDEIRVVSSMNANVEVETSGVAGSLLIV